LIRYVKKQAKKLINNDEAIVFVHDGDDREISGDPPSEDEEAAYTTSGKHEDGQLGDTNNNADENFVPLKHGIEDAFLNLDEMNAFLDEQDALEASKGEEENDEESDDDDIDYFADVPDQDEDESEGQGRSARYDDFYDAPDTDVLTYDDAFNKFGEDGEEDLEGDDEEYDEEDGMPAQKQIRKVRKAASQDDINGDNLSEVAEEEEDEEEEDEEEEDEEDDGDEDGEDAGETESKGNTGMSLFNAEDDEDGSLSTFQKQQKALKRKIDNIEDSMLQEKTWAMRGEATRADRPADSLLEPEFEFEHASKPAPVMTTESTGNLEDIIKRRIADQLWDDVERRKETLGADRRTTSLPEVSEEQSKEGLAEVYEKDYREQVMGEEAAPTELSKEEHAIELDFKSLCYKLDALANFHYAPKPPKVLLCTWCSWHLACAECKFLCTFPMVFDLHKMGCAQLNLKLIFEAHLANWMRIRYNVLCGCDSYLAIKGLRHVPNEKTHTKPLKSPMRNGHLHCCSYRRTWRLGPMSQPSAWRRQYLWVFLMLRFWLLKKSTKSTSI